MLKKVRQLIEPVNDTLKGQLDLEQHGGRTIEGVSVRVAQRVLTLTAAIWHSFQTGPGGQPLTDRLRPLTVSGKTRLGQGGYQVQWSWTFATRDPPSVETEHP